MAKMQKKNLNSPDQTMTFEKGKAEVVKVGNVTITRMTFEPGWRWSEHVKPIAKTGSCEKKHLIYCIEGRSRVRMNDGTELEYGPGDVVSIPPGHDGWTVGDKTFIGIDISQE